MTAPKRKLIEVALPLEAINRESARERSIRHGHPSTLHLWWSRKPLAACRAVLFAQLVDDPSSHPEKFPTPELQAAERKRLFDLIERLVKWDNAGDERLLNDAYAEIAACFDGKPPAVLDPFAGGGSIPLEAQRLGLEAHASDLNPVAVLINKALIEIPPKWGGRPPVFPGAAESRMGDWPRATGLAEDVRRYGAWMRDEAEKRIGHLYPKAKLTDGSEVTVIAWLWARTVTCPNPACGAQMPLNSTLWLSKKKGRPTWLKPIVNGSSVTFDIVVDPSGPPNPPKKGRGAKFACLACGGITTDEYIKAEGMAGQLGQQLLAIVAEGTRRRIYLPASDEHVAVATVLRPDDVPEAELADDPRNIWCASYGLRTFADLFTSRQLIALTTLSNLIGEVRARIVEDSAAVMSLTDRSEYADSVATYLAFCVNKAVARNSEMCAWETGMDRLRGTFQRQALPMTWDFAEANIFGDAGGDFGVVVKSEVEVIERFSGTGFGVSDQSDASRVELKNAVISTDPPYYDNIGYADLSDFFYVWLRRSLRSSYPDLLSTLLTPKVEELVATPYRFGGSKAKAERHFENGFIRIFNQIMRSHSASVPITVYYAFKQSESDHDGTASTGWETMLNGLIQAGLVITATWPMRSELSNRMLASGTNALASSIVLACRRRQATADSIPRRAFIQALRLELPTALREMQQGSVAPVDLAQAAVGPGMAVFSRYHQVVEPSGDPMTVRTALALINQVLDEVLAEQEGDFDADTRFCVKWFTQYGFNDGESGTADTLSRATNTSVAGLERGGIFRARAGKARLLGFDELSTDWDPATDERISTWEVAIRLAKALDERGGEDAARLMAAAGERVDLDAVKELAYLLYSICEKRGWTQTALLFNGLGTSWSDLSSAAQSNAARAPKPVQDTLMSVIDEGE